MQHLSIPKFCHKSLSSLDFILELEGFLGALIAINFKIRMYKICKIYLIWDSLF